MVEKIIEIDGHKLIYKEYTNDRGYDKVMFYQDYNIIKYKKYLIFGDEIEKKEPVILFEIYGRLDNINRSKDWWHKEIRKNLYIVERKEQIQKGELL